MLKIVFGNPKLAFLAFLKLWPKSMLAKNLEFEKQVLQILMQEIEIHLASFVAYGQFRCIEDCPKNIDVAREEKQPFDKIPKTR